MRTGGHDGPKVSVVITCYNYSRFLPEAVESVIAQTFRDFEIIIVNDGSTDNSLDVAKNMAARYPETAIKVIDQENQGVQRARNNGIMSARGKYVMVLDADDKLAPDCLETATELLDYYSDIKIAYSYIKAFGELSCIIKYSDFNPKLLRKRNIINVHALFHRDCWEAVNGYKPELLDYEDWEFWVSMVEKGFAARLIKKPLVHYRVQKTSRSVQSLKHRAEAICQIKSLHPRFFAPGISKYFGEHAALGYFRLVLPINRFKERLNQLCSFLLNFMRRCAA